MGGTSSFPGHVTITPVYWVPSGFSFGGSYQSIIDGYLANVAAASWTAGNVFGVGTQYFQQLSGQRPQYIQYDVQHGTAVNVSDAFPQSGNSACTPDFGYSACITDAGLQSELQQTLQTRGLPVNDSHLYMVFFPPGAETCFDSSNQQCSANVYCGYHSAFQLGAEPAIYANMPYANLNGCSDPFDGAQAPNGDPYADAEISIVSHEANESITDWNGAWYDQSGAEDGDECAYVYGNPLGGSLVQGTAYNQVINGTPYYTQDEFSNFDYATGTGDITSPNDSTLVAGCIQRPTFPPHFSQLPGLATDVSVGADGTAWVVGTSPVGGGFKLYRWSGSGWTPAPGAGVTIAVGPDGNPWVVNSVHQIYHWTGSSWTHEPGAANDVAVGANGMTWVVGTNPVGGGFGLYQWSGSGWVRGPGGAVTIANAPYNRPWVVNSAHRIFAS